MDSGVFASAMLQGFGLGLSLIVAIGAQNAFVLRQGLQRQHVFTLATICFVSDALLIALGCAGFGALVQAHPQLVRAVSGTGAAFLIVYGWGKARAAWSPQGLADSTSPAPHAGLRRIVLTGLALTWLNPHVYLDTVLLLGGIAGRYPAEPRLGFALGAMTASAVWFYGLGYGAGLLAPLFHRPMTWRLLDAVIALTMWTIAAFLLLGSLR